jgi:hypothetical protein
MSTARLLLLVSFARDNRSTKKDVHVVRYVCSNSVMSACANVLRITRNGLVVAGVHTYGFRVQRVVLRVLSRQVTHEGRLELFQVGGRGHSTPPSYMHTKWYSLAMDSSMIWSANMRDSCVLSNMTRD